MAAKKKADTAAGPDLMSMFSQASQGSESTPKGKKDTTAYHIFASIGANLRAKRLKAQVWAFNLLEAAIKTDEAAIKADIRDEYFIPMGMKNLKKPENCKVKVGNSGATIDFQLKKRSSASGLSADEIALCKLHGISLSENVIVQAGLKINEECLNSETLKALSELIAANPDKLPRNLIVPQPKIFKTIVGDDALDNVFKLKTKEAVETMLPIVAVQAIIYSGEGASTEEDFDEIESLLFPKEEV